MNPVALVSTIVGALLALSSLGTMLMNAGRTRQRTDDHLNRQDEHLNRQDEHLNRLNGRLDSMAKSISELEAHILASRKPFWRR